MVLLTPPVISLAELHLSLPDNEALWQAPTANAWKELLLSQSVIPPTRPSVIDCMNDITVLSSSNPLIDIHIAACVFLFASWGLVWQHKQSVAVTKPQSPGSLLLTSQHQNLTQSLNNFRANYDPYGPAWILVELELLHLNISIEDVQLFVGLEGPQEAARVYPVLRTWGSTKSARQAVWHAGQIVRAVRSHPEEAVRDFHAVAAYHAGLALWAYGSLLRATPRLAASEAHGTAPTVYLDGAETPESRRFIDVGRGTPAISCSEPKGGPAIPTFVDDGTAVMDTVSDLLRQNQETKDVPRPALVDSLIELMAGLEIGCDDNGDGIHLI